MSEEKRSKIYHLIDSIKDENILHMIMDDATYCVTDELSAQQLKELDDVISEADINSIVDWEDFTSEMDE